MGIVVEPAALDEDMRVGTERLDLVAGDELGEVEGVRADIADRTGGAGPGGVGAPRGLLLAAVLDPRGEPVLRVLDLDDAQRPDRPPATMARACRTSG